MASIIRLHVAAPLAPGAVIATTAAQAHYLAHVMRRRAGDALRVFNGADGEFDAVIENLGRQAANLAVTRQTRAQAPEQNCWLCFAPLKRAATDLIVEKATELGVSAIRPVFTERSQSARVNLERLAAIAIEAAEQSERLSVPDIAAPVDLPRLIAAWPAERRLFVAAERAQAPPLATIAGLQPAALLIGPEGGFAPAELDVLAHHAFVTVVSLGPRVLRAETAAIAGLARMIASPATD